MANGASFIAEKLDLEQEGFRSPPENHNFVEKDENSKGTRGSGDETKDPMKEERLKEIREVVVEEMDIYKEKPKETKEELEKVIRRKMAEFRKEIKKWEQVREQLEKKMQSLEQNYRLVTLEGDKTNSNMNKKIKNLQMLGKGVWLMQGKQHFREKEEEENERFEEEAEKARTVEQEWKVENMKKRRKGVYEHIKMVEERKGRVIESTRWVAERREVFSARDVADGTRENFEELEKR
ncbi:trichoplein keratin filament-binding protein-like [Belonocnema kinseyi]|uniref:trichoplein keratin filament-binding protein-like n=1 Tax=Belonocnema kinseyi TaxID=2817044 RepID=UPI00143CCC1D|nr:trichoplein keratin filament-binding protein-like [Belonocnema kinseyi]